MDLDLDRLNAEFANQPEKLVEWAIGLGKPAICTTNFRPFEAVILHMVSQAKADIPRAQDEKANLSSFGLTLAPAASVAGAGSSGVVVSDIDPDGTAAQKGLQTGDVILEAAGKPVTRPSDVSSAISDAKKDGHKAVLLRVKTGDNVRYVALSTQNAG